MCCNQLCSCIWWHGAARLVLEEGTFSSFVIHPQSVSFILQTTNHCCACMYTRILWYLAVAEGRGQSLRTDMHLVSSYSVAKLCIPQTIKIVYYLPIHTDTLVSLLLRLRRRQLLRPSCRTVQSYLWTTHLGVNLFSDNSFIRDHIVWMWCHTGLTPPISRVWTGCCCRC